MDLCMETPSGSITGILLIGALVAVGVWYSRDSAVHDVKHAGASHREENPAEFPSASGKRVDWSADGRSLLILSRNGADEHVQMTLHDLARPHEPTTVDLPGDVVSGASLAIDDHV